ncbi:hypothetical protein [Nodularia sp. UHCC 0506]|uniref:hypothetical protein n=1 Tax=Nodularia sp. UHCC 0506 TaxID=3110243 RepID=UPI002B218AC4|nr:hypothetical protein [Nodularia sp. UHCC 0506]MEA5517275.1 hypothetical protein [Nodularia sp. UHCC 0506]
MKCNFIQRKLDYLRVIATVISIFFPLSITSEVRAETFQNVDFFPDLLLIDNQVGTVRGITTAVVQQGTGSVTIETNNPLLYFNPFTFPNPNVDFPCGFGTPGIISGLSDFYTFNFGNQAQCTGGVGYYALFYETRLTNNFGTFPSPFEFQSMQPAYGQVIRLMTGARILADQENHELAFILIDENPNKIPEPNLVMGLIMISLAALSLKFYYERSRNIHSINRRATHHLL